MQTYFGADCELVACPPIVNTFLMINNERWTYLPWLRRQATLYNHVLKMFMSWCESIQLSI